MADFKLITSKDNPLIKQISSLQSSAKARKESGLFVLEGLRICSDAYENSVAFEKLIISQSAEEKYKKEIALFSSNAKELILLSDNLFAKISDTSSPQGIIALGVLPHICADNIKNDGRYIILENIQDPSNLGAVSRTAEALGVDAILIVGGCDPYAPKSLRASMGTLLRMPIISITDIKELAISGIKTYACVVDKDAKSITEVDFKNGSAVIIGNEANGITEETKALADEKITIRMSGKAESLNAAVAASIAMWEMMK